MSTVVAVVTAAGSGTRLGGDGPKALVRIGEKTILEHALENLLGGVHLVQAVAVTIPAGYESTFSEAIARTRAGGVDVPVVLTVGGASRQASVYAGLQILKAQFPRLIDSETVVLVHDAARCFTPATVTERVVAAVRGGASAVVPGVPVSDTIKEVGEANPATTEEEKSEGSLGEKEDVKVEAAIRTLDRSLLRAVQTPQGFRFDELYRAHREFSQRGEEEAGSASDDATLVEAYGGPSVVVAGDAMAYKITTPRDLALAQLLRLGHDE